jgi:hypothetical protein
MKSDEVFETPQGEAAVSARLAEARLGVHLGGLLGRYQIAIMASARLGTRPALHAQLCAQRDQLEALIARLQPALLFEEEPAVV